ncbi:MAG TPA: hypothetical protein VJU61_21220, partial [Polyangiaceae bacterium]|nr:hypothetical protein [Polyangiaceae bacterium]
FSLRRQWASRQAWLCAAFLGASAGSCSRAGGDLGRPSTASSQIAPAATVAPLRPTETVTPAVLARAETQRRALEELREFETLERQRTDFARAAESGERFGADPYRVAGLPDGRVLGLLRGSGELLLLDTALAPLARAPAPARASALVVGGASVAFAAGELEARVYRYHVSDGVRLGDTIEVPGLHSLRALAYGPPDVLYAASQESSELFVVTGASGPEPVVQRLGQLGRSPDRLAVAGGYLVASCFLDHSLVLLALDASGRPSGPSWRAVHDGPFWGLAAARWGQGVLIAASGVEDHPLDRRIGSFGYIDSFLYVYELDPDAGLQRRLAIDASEQGVLTGRAVSLEVVGAAPTIVLQGYGSPRTLRARLSPELELLQLDTSESPPGSADLLQLPGGAVVSASPLLDAFFRVPASGAVQVVPVPSRDTRSPLQKLGEALEFTSLMAPQNSARGALSRFTCETCHFEGGTDGRVHHTGRGDVVATTKPLRGLFNNRPYFSRALDPDLALMVNNEFRAAGAGSGQSPWFGLELDTQPWLAWLGVSAEQLTPAALRSALASQLMLAAHPPNPLARQARAWSPDEARGVELFRQRCETCHEARLISDDAQSRVPFENWHELVFSEAGPIVWARNSYERTGIMPLVHPLGARVPSLRRVYAKYPYFTNGSAPSLEALTRQVRWSARRFYHRAPDGMRGLTQLSPEERRQLEAFLRLL